MTLEEVLDVLDYNNSSYYLRTNQKREPEVASLFRAAHSTGVDGIYVFQSSSEKNTTFSVRPAVYVAEAQTAEAARIIHRKLWNLGQAPFLIVVLPNHIRVYTGFDYSREDDGVGIVESQVALDRNSILEQLADFCAEAINNGQLWHKRSSYMKPDRRVDRRLLKNLSRLGEVLREKMNLAPKIAHALIGKYVYIRYLRDRKILSDDWFEQHDINIDTVFGRNATVNGLRRLCTILDNRFNGNIFPLDFGSHDAPKDEHVEYVASIFKGDELLPGGGRQYSFDSLDFQVYDFAYIPIELLSAIYEQFLHIEGKGKKVGAYYTPEYLADYLISEMSSVMPLREGVKVLDPACGSGVFLVLIYARLIEMRLAQSEASTLSLPELLDLLKHIYGIERELDACYVTEFSLILMLLHYVDVSEFLHDEHFKLPSLHNTHIFQYDFFDDASPVWTQGMKFDWIIGNPPWIKANDPKEPQPLAAAWIDARRKQQPVDNNSVAEAFCWRVLNLLVPTGYVGLILPAALLYNLGARKYRQSFFEQCEVRRMTNFSNLRGELFEGRATAPAITIIYHQALARQEKRPIEHYGPFAINQITKTHGKLWTITINEHEFQTVSPYEAAGGDIATWKFALWGTHRDKRAIARLHKFFPQTLGQLCEEPAWHLHEGSQLRKSVTKDDTKLEYHPELLDKKRLDTTRLNKSGYLFSIPDDALENIPQEECYIRVRGGEKGLLVSEPPHIIMNEAWKYSIYSDTYFVIKPRQIGLSAPSMDADRLRALSVFLSSSFVKYYLFFQAPTWGIERDAITLNTVRSIPIPVFALEQVEQLAALQKKLVLMELEQGAKYAQAYLDEQITRILQVPESITTLVTEFLELRVNLVGGGTREAIQKAQQRPDQKALQEYAQQLADGLDGFLDSGKTHHRVILERSRDLICCTVEFVRSDHAFAPVVKEAPSENGQMFTRLQQGLKEEFSQWVYVQRGLKIFGPSSVSLYKVPQLINWTHTQAMNDADEMIAEILSTVR